MEDLNKALKRLHHDSIAGTEEEAYEEMFIFIRQREKELLEEFTEIVGENEVCPCDKLDCPIRRSNPFREELLKKLEELSNE